MTLIYHGRTDQLCPCCGGPKSAADCSECNGTGYEHVHADVLGYGHDLIQGLDYLAAEIHNENRVAGWWTDLATGADLLDTRNRGEMLMLGVTELDEAEDARRDGLNDDKLPDRPGYHVELGDCAIRLLDQLGAEQRASSDEYALIIAHNEHRSASVARSYREITNAGPGGNLMWIVGALAKSLDEGYRKDKVRVARYWLTVALFRIIALAAHEGIPLFEIIEEKRAYNRNRADHKVENRRADGGKKC
ncbi:MULTISPECIES: hypothetical protein [unclassified Sphingopyxis]|uniref:hypothetical protein n=1 Tax=unclassified Sphingopyxis TaxID=2614943 RepID=UPI00285B1BD8|nr:MULTISPECIES: hypothetical protein [unclassified Sphingopyxis]MDR7061991.1 hypothetical protein [Sphingopyxis sp. BE235]MDR7182450.1 hypothetical protein [Sphingopyxis sp. BE249]